MFGSPSNGELFAVLVFVGTIIGVSAIVAWEVVKWLVHHIAVVLH